MLKQAASFMGPTSHKDSSHNIKNLSEFKSLSQKRGEVMQRINDSQKSLSSKPSKMTSGQTHEMMQETKKNYQEFMKNRKLISRFDPRRKEFLVKKQLQNLENHKDYTRINIIKA